MPKELENVETGTAVKEKEKEKAKETKEKADDKVELSGSQYNAILDRMQELEDAALQSRRSGPRSVDELAEEVDRGGRQTERKEFDPDALERLSNAQLAQFIMQQVNLGVGQPLLVKLEEIRVKDEIKDLRREIKEDSEDGKTDDFDEHRDRIYKIASRNPNLSIREAYKLAKEEGGAKPSKRRDNEKGDETPQRGRSRDALLSLPPRVNPHSEKPTHSSSSLSKSDPATRMDAAKLALEEMERKGQFK